MRGTAAFFRTVRLRSRSLGRETASFSTASACSRSQLLSLLLRSAVYYTHGVPFFRTTTARARISTRLPTITITPEQIAAPV